MVESFSDSLYPGYSEPKRQSAEKAGWQMRATPVGLLGKGTQDYSGSQ